MSTTGLDRAMLRVQKERRRKLDKRLMRLGFNVHGDHYNGCQLGNGSGADCTCAAIAAGVRGRAASIRARRSRLLR